MYKLVKKKTAVHDPAYVDPLAMIYVEKCKLQKFSGPSLVYMPRCKCGWNHKNWCWNLSNAIDICYMHLKKHWTLDIIDKDIFD